MKKQLKINHLFLIGISIILSFGNLYAENIYKNISVEQCDSLIQANVQNPNFVILDVRTYGEWYPDHLEGSINRSTGDSDFLEQLDALPRHKIYLIHCQSGGRSAGAFTKMQSLEFFEVYEMRGGMNSWKSVYPSATTAEHAPKIMLASNQGITTDTVVITEMDTLQFTITNRANDTLRFTSIEFPAGDEFTSNFDVTKKLQGAEDYPFEVYYSPENIVSDSTKITIESNGGQLQLDIILKTGTLQSINSNHLNELVVYPIPAKSNLYFKNSSLQNIEEISIVNLNGKVVLNASNLSISEGINVSGLTSGIYFVRLKSGNQLISKKIVVRQ
jgi:rhodanese-related sulfurtransferase